MSTKYLCMPILALLTIVCGDEPDGEALYAAKCAACHGADGTGATSGPDITELVSTLSQSEMEDAILNGIGDMPPILVSEDEAAAITRWAQANLAQ